MPSNPRSWRHQRGRPESAFVKSSLRTVKAGQSRLIVGHLKGEKQRTARGRTRLTVQAVLTPRSRVDRKHNPWLALLNRGTPIGRGVREVVYDRHATQGNGPWVHRFKRGDVEVRGLPSGAAVIASRAGARVWSRDGSAGWLANPPRKRLGDISPREFVAAVDKLGAPAVATALRWNVRTVRRKYDDMKLLLREPSDGYAAGEKDRLRALAFGNPALRWSMHAGGTAAPPRTHGYTAWTDHGEYHIDPVGPGSGFSRGYVVRFLNTRGVEPGGLYKDLGKVSSPNAAKALAAQHVATIERGDRWHYTNKGGRMARKARKGKRRPPRGFKTWAAYMASIRPNAPARRRTHRRARTNKGETMARHRSRAHRRNDPGRRGRRKHFRRNPPAFVRGIAGTLLDGVKGGALVVGGKIVSRAVPQFLGITPVGPLGLGVQTLVGAGAYLILDRFTGRELSRPFLFGVFSNAIESLVRGWNVPVLSPALGDECELHALAGYFPKGVAGYGPGTTAALGAASADDEVGAPVMVMGA